MRVLEGAVVGLALALVVAGAVVGVLVAPPFTRMAFDRLDIAAELETGSGLSAERSAEVAESVRRYVTDRSAPPLPSEVEGVPAFDEAAVSHLNDVRSALLGARLATGVLAAGLAVWLAFSIARRRWDAIARGLWVGAALCVGVPVIAATVGLLDFDGFFSAFHAIFFRPGTWTFPESALLIGLFPERFWVTAGASWAAGIVLGGAALALGARAVGHAEQQRTATPGAVRA